VGHRRGWSPWVVGSSASFQNCMHHQQDDVSVQPAIQQSGAASGGPIVSLTSRVVCAGNFADTNQGAITALATLLIAIFTYTLRNATISLWESVERQLDQFRRSLNICQPARVSYGKLSSRSRSGGGCNGARRHRNATNVEIIKGVALTNKDIADRQKLVTELQSRAYLSVGFAAMVNQNNETRVRFEPRMQLQNDRLTPVYQVMYRIYADVLSHPLSPDFTFPLPEALPTRSVSTIGRGQHKILAAFVPKLYFAEEADQIRIGASQRVYIWGHVEYEDAFKISRYVNFCMSFYSTGKDVSTQNDIFMGADTARHNDSD
jgi:hypothetical protein